MIKSIGLGFLSLIILPLFLISSPYFLYRYWIPDGISREGSNYQGAWFTYKDNMKYILMEEAK